MSDLPNMNRVNGRVMNAIGALCGISMYAERLAQDPSEENAAELSAAIERFSGYSDAVLASVNTLLTTLQFDELESGMEIDGLQTKEGTQL